MKKENLSGDTGKECIENGEKEECLNNNNNNNNNFSFFCFSVCLKFEKFEKFENRSTSKTAEGSYRSREGNKTMQEDLKLEGSWKRWCARFLA